MTHPIQAALTRDQLQERLAALDARLPALLAEYPDRADFWNAFAGEAEFAIEDAGEADYDWVNGEVDAILKKHHGVISLHGANRTTCDHTLDSP